MSYFSRLLILLAVWSSLLPTAQAQAPTFDRAVACGSGQGYYGWGPKRMVMDGQGNTYVTGSFTGTVAFGNILLTAPGTQVPGQNAPADLFVAKLDAAGNYVWAVQGGGQAWVTTTDLAVDATGSVYLTGYFDSYSVVFGTGGPTLFNSSARTEGFIAKLNGARQQWQWARRFGGTANDYGRAVTVNPRGEVYITGDANGATAGFGPVTLTTTSSSALNSCWAKLDTNGNWRWARQMGAGKILALDLLGDAQGNIYAAGRFSAPSASFGSNSLTTNFMVGSPTPEGGDVFVAKADSTGNWRWAVQGDAVNGQNIADFGAMAYDGAGHLYLCGGYRNVSARFGNTILPNVSSMAPPASQPPMPNTNNYYSDAYVARIDAATSGWQWATRVGGPSGDYIGGITADSQGRVYVGGAQALGTGFPNPLPGVGTVNLAQLDAATGAWRWTMQTAPLVVQDIGSDITGRLCLGGYFSGQTASFGSIVLPSAGPGMDTGFLARMTAGPLTVATGLDQPTASLEVWPNPSQHGTVWVLGPPPGQRVQVLDALGRKVSIGQMPATGPLALALPAALPAGVYVVRSATQVRRLVIE